MPNYRYNQTSCPSCRQPQLAVPFIAKDINNSMPLAMAYVPWQTWCDIYDAEKALHCGTIFQELNLPFCGKGGVKR